MNTFRVNSVYQCSSFYENILAVSFVGSALGADKKVNLAVGIYVIVDAAKTAWSSAQGRPVNVRGDGFHLAHGYSLARFGRPIWTVELGLHSLASLVSGRTLDEVAGGTARNAQGKLRFLDASHVKVHQEASNPAGGQQNQAIGRTKGGFNTKISAWVDGLGRAVSLSLAPGQHADVWVAQTASRPKLRGTITVADKGYDRDGFRAQLRSWGSRPCILPRGHRLAPAAWHRGHYRKRHKVENLFQRLKR
jgi:transposase